LNYSEEARVVGAAACLWDV